MLAWNACIQALVELQMQKLGTCLQDVLDVIDGEEPPGRRWWRQKSCQIVLVDAGTCPGLLQEVTQISTICASAQTDKG